MGTGITIVNYFQLIQEISKIKLGKAPSAFSDISSNKFNKIIEALQDSIEDFYMSASWEFRNKKTTFSTVDGQQEYQHTYGNIKRLLVTDTNNEKRILHYHPDYAFLLTLDTTDEGIPEYYSIYGGEIILHPIPDQAYTMTVLYESQKWAKYVGVIDQSSASGQANVYITETEGFSVGDSVTIEPDTPRAETLIISSITEDDYLTMTANLASTHASGSVELYKNSFTYEADEPNFPSRFHTILEYDSLRRLYYGDPARVAKYERLYRDKYKTTKMETRISKQSNPYFKV